MYRLRNNVEDHQTGGRSPGVFHTVQEIRRPAAAVVRTPRSAAVRIVGPGHGGRFRDPEQRVQPSARAEELASVAADLNKPTRDLNLFKSDLNLTDAGKTHIHTHAHGRGPPNKHHVRVHKKPYRPDDTYD